MGETLQVLGGVAASVGAAMKKYGKGLPGNLAELEADYYAGEITATELLCGLFGVATAAEALGILGAAGLTLGGVYLILKCANHW